MKAHGRLIHLARGPFYLLCTLVTYLSIRPGPDASSVPFFPHSLGLWFDRHDLVRNLFGYGCLALAGFAGAAFGPGDMLSIAWVRRRTLKVAAGKWLAGMLILVVVLEMVQTMLPRRTAHWRDVAAGWAAIILVWAVCCLLGRIRPIQFITPPPRAWSSADMTP